MTWVDAVVLAVLAISALLAFSRGLVREVLGSGRLGRRHLHRRLGAAARAAAGAAMARHVALGGPRRLRRGVHRQPDRAVRLSPAASAASCAARSLGGLDRTLGLVFGLVRGAALVVLAYIIAGWWFQVDRWPEVVLQARSLPLVYQGASWAVQKLPADHRPQLYAPPPGREATADDLLRASPARQGCGNSRYDQESSWPSPA